MTVEKVLKLKRLLVGLFIWFMKQNHLEQNQSFSGEYLQDELCANEIQPFNASVFVIFASVTKKKENEAPEPEPGRNRSINLKVLRNKQTIKAPLSEDLTVYG